MNMSKENGLWLVLALVVVGLVGLSAITINQGSQLNQIAHSLDSVASQVESIAQSQQNMRTPNPAPTQPIPAQQPNTAPSEINADLTASNQMNGIITGPIFNSEPAGMAEADLNSMAPPFICAEDQGSKQDYCTHKYIRYANLGIGYKIIVPPGSYSVYQGDEQTHARIYATPYSACWLRLFFGSTHFASEQELHSKLQQECPSKTPLVFTVKGGETMKDALVGYPSP